MSTSVPRWFEPVSPAGWPTRAVENAALGYRLPIHTAWKAGQMSAEGDLYPEDQYRGPHISEGLSVQVNREADPKAPLGDWAIAQINLAGHPLETIPAGTEVQVMEFKDVGSHKAVAKSWGVDDVHSIVVLARILGPESALVRCYIVLARRKRIAWKFNLSFMSACLPGTAEDVVNRNDHVRAAASFGFVTLT